MELKMTPFTVPQSIIWNYEELKTALAAKAEAYATVAYTDDQIRLAKADRANLNRLKKALNDERIRQEREYMQPFATFKMQINEVIGIIDKPIEAIDLQVKAFEERQKAEKRQCIEAYWQGTAAPEWLRSVKPTWLNASCSMKTIVAEIDAIIAQAEKDLAVIRNLPAYAFEVEEYYKNTLSLADAVREANRLEEMAKRKAAHEAQHQSVPVTIRESQTVEPVENPEQMNADDPEREWIAFQALLSPEEASALGQYMKTRGIQYKAI